MKLKNIFFIAVLIGLISSCTSEELINSPIPNNNDETFSLILTTKGISTKADDYVSLGGYATADELVINKVTVAVFGQGAGEIRGIKTVTANDENFTKTTQQLPGKQDEIVAYRIDGIRSIMGAVRVAVIANSEIDFSAISNYDEFIKAIETTQLDETFDPKNLVKVGQKDVTLVETGNEVVVVPLNQLAARIDMSINMKLPLIEKGKEIRYPMANIVDYIGKNLNNTKKDKPYIVEIETGEFAGEYKAWNEKDLPAGLKYINPSTNNEESFDNTKVAAFEGLVIDSVKVTERFGLQINKITINNIQTQTTTLLDGGNKLDLKAIVWEKDIDKFITGSYKITFYTYEKPKYDNDNHQDVLNVNIDAELLKGQTEITQRYSVNTLGIWVDKETLSPVNGWGEGSTSKFIAIHNEDGESLGEANEIFVKDTDYQSFERIMTFPINPSPASPEDLRPGGLMHGNLYSLDVNISKELPTYTIEWEVSDWITGEPVNINFN